MFSHGRAAVFAVVFASISAPVLAVDPQQEWTHEPQCNDSGRYPASQQPVWYKPSHSDTVIVFVHGILSNNRAGWLADNCEYFPELIAKRPEFLNAGIFLGGFYTAVNAGNYDAVDAANHLFDRMNQQLDGDTRPALDRNQIIFIAHSTGGIIVRQMLSSHPHAFLEKRIGLVLLASPTLGSAWADVIAPIATLAGNELAKQLATDSPFLRTLDNGFQLYLNQNRDSVFGIEIVEQKFLVKGWWGLWDWKVVDRTSGSVYFRPPKSKPNANHFEVAKPTGPDDDTFLWTAQFYENMKFASNLHVLDYSKGKVARLGVTYWKQDYDIKGSDLPIEYVELPSDPYCQPEAGPPPASIYTCVVHKDVLQDSQNNPVVGMTATFGLDGPRMPEGQLIIETREGNTFFEAKTRLLANPGQRWRFRLAPHITSRVARGARLVELPAKEFALKDQVSFHLPYDSSMVTVKGTILGRSVAVPYGKSDDGGWLVWDAVDMQQEGYDAKWSLNRPNSY